ncbi:energy-coupling factor ABC transporter ATP-binding protein [Lacticaseibacillus thailandensis]|uniref:Cobalt transporter ATP-binding subunit n=1 Tax=Lacticaseibacillus thailandensis DSM 22698 = JCM 13996 TaxID=1423810 RepID=A0A0R2CFF5_9LACO|nr:energy-coupling factor ABC transporter ATP-binding protein [Lacticaseibacillus thailandensis]KRM86908.1 cobalt transporter ATP-binding subunit [Lacticaseibacillus thailandensis DSM 22698 = JCM 13996]
MQPVIDIQDLSFRYREATTDALKHVSLTVNPGEWVAIIGRNGSGKSTLAGNIIGLLEPERGSVTSGHVTVSGLPLDDEHVWDIRARVGIVFQNPDNQFVGATVADDIAFGMENRAVPRAEMQQRVQAALSAVGMTDFAEREPARLSGGQKQRVAIAGIVAQAPDIIILDEATSMLDPAGRRAVIDLVTQLQQERHMTVLSITHDLDEAARADRIIMLAHGAVADVGTPAEIFTRGTELAANGLDVPFPEQLKVALRARGVSVPDDYRTEKGLVDYLWTLRSTM